MIFFSQKKTFVLNLYTLIISSTMAFNLYPELNLVSTSQSDK